MSDATDGQRASFVYTYRVGYADTDRMGFMHHSRYAVLLESARTEMLRTSGVSYLQWEEQGFLLPVLELHIQYARPCRYDDIVEVRTRLTERSRLRLAFEYEVWNATRSEQAATGTTRHVFMSAEGRPVRATPHIVGLLEKLP